MKSINRKLHILLVEDSECDTMLIQRSFDKSKLDHTLHCVEDGERAIAFLKNYGEYKKVARPDLIILDLNLPRLDGREVLAQIKQDSNFKRIPVIILTTSNAEQDVMRSYDLHANCYIVKPFDVYDFLQIANLIEQFWLKTVILPSVQIQ